VRDGSVSYQAEIQRALDCAGEQGGEIVFPPMRILAVESGWQVPSGITVRLEGSVIAVRKTANADGAVFHLDSVSDVTFTGGEIVGHNALWPDGVNVRGIKVVGASAGIRVSQMKIRDLTSNGVGIFGAPEKPIRDVWLRDLVIDHCCNRYPDYLSGEKWEKGSERIDQGLIALYHVDDFVVDGCRLERSRSDGTHFYECRNGHITNNRIYGAKMGGYFVEGGENIVGLGNVMRDNGSRGTTIERGATNCVFANNVVASSGREGLWAPDCRGLVVRGNTFDRNGRKPNGKERYHIWNANITINEARKDPSESPAENYLVTENLLFTDPSQVAAIRIDTTANMRGVVVRNNLLRGENRTVLVEGPNPSAVQIERP
jgi:hypothetical protein